MCSKLPESFGCSPVPEMASALAIARGDELTVGRDRDLARETRDGVPGKSLFVVEFEPFTRSVHDDLVVQRLAYPALAAGVQGGGWDTVHRWLADILDGDWDVVIPDQHLLVVGGGHDSAIVVNEKDGVDGAEVVVVLLNDIAFPDVILDNFLVRTPHENDVGILRIELDAVRHLVVPEV